MFIKVTHTPCVDRQPLSSTHLFTGGIVKKDEAYVELEAMKMIMPLKAGYCDWGASAWLEYYDML